MNVNLKKIKAIFEPNEILVDISNLFLEKESIIKLLKDCIHLVDQSIYLDKLTVDINATEAVISFELKNTSQLIVIPILEDKFDIYLKQQFLNFLPLPHEHFELRPNLNLT